MPKMLSMRKIRKPVLPKKRQKEKQEMLKTKISIRSLGLKIRQIMTPMKQRDLKEERNHFKTNSKIRLREMLLERHREPKKKPKPKQKTNNARKITQQKTPQEPSVQLTMPPSSRNRKQSGTKKRRKSRKPEQSIWMTLRRKSEKTVK